MINRLKKVSPEFKIILDRIPKLAHFLKFKIYLVGGVVRDLILDNGISDLDIVVEGDAILFAKKIADEYKGSFKKHYNFGTATVIIGNQRIDFATARTEKYLNHGALPIVRPERLELDLSRRDFTINSMAISLNNEDYGKLIDPGEAINDLKKGLIRILHERSFLEDPTRILRAIRFEQRFNFKIEKTTFKLMKEAIAKGALKFVNAHRLREDLILILKEPRPYRYIKRIQQLEGFLFLSRELCLDDESFKFFLRLQQSVFRYQNKFKEHRDLKVWLIYLAGILVKLTPKKLDSFLADFGFKKGERIIIKSIKEGVNKVKEADKNIKAYLIHRMMTPYSFESILFFYAYHERASLRKNIENFLNKLVDIRLKIKGADLKAQGLKPFTLYGKTLTATLHAKIEKNFTTKQQEIDEAVRIFKKLKLSKR